MINSKEAAQITEANIKVAVLKDIEEAIINKAQEGKNSCWIFIPITADDQRELIRNGYMIAKDGKDYRITW
jgi:hypothetical protein